MKAATTESPLQDPAEGLRRRLAQLGRRFGEREAVHRPALAEARKRAERLRELTAGALAAFELEAERAGAPHLRFDVGPVEPDAKHLRAHQFVLSRGRYRAIVTVRSRGEVTLVGPYAEGRSEAPCHTFPWSAEPELLAALAELLEHFVELATTP